MKTRTLLLAIVMVATASTAFAQAGTRKAEWFKKPLGPIGLDGAPPTPLCRSSLGNEMHIHCLHNVIWHGGNRYFIDDAKNPKAKPVP